VDIAARDENYLSGMFRPFAAFGTNQSYVHVRLRTTARENTGHNDGVSKQTVKLSLCLIPQTLRHIEIWGTSALDGGEWPASSFLPLCPSGKNPRYPLGGRLDGLQRRALDDVEKRRILRCRESNPGLPACSSALYLLRCCISILG
jgi:hypothetical protein